MTKEELEKEIKNYIDKNCNQWETDGLTVDDIVRVAVLDFAEPREKRIAELEAKNAELMEKVEGYNRNRDRLIAMGFPHFRNCKEYAEKLKELEAQVTRAIEVLEGKRKQIADLTEQNTSLLTSVENLNKSVQELEAQIEKMKCCYNCKHSRTEYEHCKTDKHEKWELAEH